MAWLSQATSIIIVVQSMVRQVEPILILADAIGFWKDYNRKRQPEWRNCNFRTGWGSSPGAARLKLPERLRLVVYVRMAIFEDVYEIMVRIYWR